MIRNDVWRIYFIFFLSVLGYVTIKRKIRVRKLKTYLKTDVLLVHEMHYNIFFFKIFACECLP